MSLWRATLIEKLQGILQKAGGLLPSAQILLDESPTVETGRFLATMLYLCFQKLAYPPDLA